MDVHVLVPLDVEHAAAARRLAEDAAGAAGVELDAATGHHISLVVVPGAEPDAVHETLRGVITAIDPFVARAHGFGFFCDGTPAGTSIHVPLVAGPELLALHRRSCAALVAAGAPPATWTDPDHWSPHVTLLDHGLDPGALGQAVARLSCRHHPRWGLRVARLVVAGPRGDAAVEPLSLLFRAPRVRP